MQTVSILTPTTEDRVVSLKFVAKGICRQTYNNIIEWVIIDGTKTENSKLPKTIKELRQMKGLPKIEFICIGVDFLSTFRNLRLDSKLLSFSNCIRFLIFLWNICFKCITISFKRISQTLVHL